MSMPSADWPGWISWPVDEKPLPTQEEWDAAEARWRTSLAPDDWSDFAGDFGMAVATYSRFTWWEFFFPDDVEGKKRAMDEAMSFAKALTKALMPEIP